MNTALMLTSAGKVSAFTFGKDEALVSVVEFQDKPVDRTTLLTKVLRLLHRKEG